jgi:tRNA threonylcarbamoyladenosine modification (KEOPS) complex  Pcc1 subunit
VKRLKAKAEASVSVTFRSKQQMEAIAQALSPELSHPAGEKAEAQLVKRGRVMRLRFAARDSSSLRAIMNSYLRMLAATLNVSASLLELERKTPSKR